MKWVKSENLKRPIKSWCETIESGALQQAENLANHPALFRHVALMPDCHVGYGMPIGGVIACDAAVIPNAVGVDIGCGMSAVKTSIQYEIISDKKLLRNMVNQIKEKIPVGEGNSRKIPIAWQGFNDYLAGINQPVKAEQWKTKKLPAWLTEHGWNLDAKNLGTLGGGNHFIEIQSDEEGWVWLMLHSGSRNLGNRIASYYHKLAVELNQKWKIDLPDKNLAYLPVDTEEGSAYIRDMNLALLYAGENRRLMMEDFMQVISSFIPGIQFEVEINIHHNYARLEHHFNRNVWVHRKGATSAQKDEQGIIPGSMGTFSYIVRGLGNAESFSSCSHGAGRKMGRADASRRLTVEECDKAMEGIVFDRWKTEKKHGKKDQAKKTDLSEAPPAYKNIDEVIESELDLIIPEVKLRPLAVVKG